MSTIFSNSFVSEHSWEATGNQETISKAMLPKVISCRIKDNVLEDGTVLKNVVLLIKGGKPESIKLAPAAYQTQYAEGTKIDPSSIVYSEYVNEEGEKRWTATCEEE